MCKAYLKDLKREGRSVQEDWPEFAEYARTHGSHFAPLLDLPSAPHSPLPPPIPEGSEAHSAGGMSPGSSSLPPTTRARRDTESRGAGEYGQIGEGVPQRDRPSAAPTTGSGRMSTMRERWAERKSRAPTIIARDRAIQKQSLVDSAERIYLRYLLPGAEREIYLPPSLRLHNFPVSSDEASPLIPDLFHAQKNYIFKALEQDAFPRFLRAKAFGNLTPLGSFVRLVAGLLILWGGFVLAFSFIFLDWKPKRTRLWLILPIFVATNLLFAAYYSLSPLLVLFQQSETTPFRMIRVNEPYVRRLLTYRALWVEGMCVLITAILTVIFALVPGHRL